MFLEKSPQYLLQIFLHTVNIFDFESSGRLRRVGSVVELVNITSKDEVGDRVKGEEYMPAHKLFAVYLIAVLLYNSLMNACPVNFKCDKRIQ